MKSRRSLVFKSAYYKLHLREIKKLLMVDNKQKLSKLERCTFVLSSHPKVKKNTLIKACRILAKESE